MQLSVLVLAALGLSAQVLAQDVVTCGNNRYTYEQVDEAAEAACEHVEDRTSVGRNKYPHSFGNREGFKFDGVSGAYYNFPIMSNGRVYTGGAPGPDRVIINAKCELAGQITHTGARGNGFVDCEDQISVKTQRNNSSDPDSAGYSTSAPGILMTSVAGALMVGAFM